MLLKPKITPDSPRLFKSGLFEFLSRTHPIAVALIYLPLVIFLLWKSYTEANVANWTMIVVAPLGALAWTFTEYWLHRAIMHCIPDFSWGERFYFWAHKIHHDWPHDPYRLVMPLPISASLFVLFFTLFYSVMGDYAWAFHAGFTLAYVIYDMVHFWVHHGKSHSRVFKILSKHHLSHHYSPKYENLHFAVSVPFWDRIFGTNSPENIPRGHVHPQKSSVEAIVSKRETMDSKK